MSLLNRINATLRKLDDPDCVVIAEKEIKSLIVNEIDNGEKLNILITAIADDKNYSTKKTQFNALKLFVAVAEIFQHQILEFLPKVFTILNKKIGQSDDTVNDIIAEAYSGVIEYSFKGADPSDSNFVLTECLRQIFELFDKNVKSIHICAGLCVSKLLQTCDISLLENNFENIYRDLTVVLKPAKEKYTVLEAMLTLVLSISSKISAISEDVIVTVLNYVGDLNPKTRKICIDVLYAVLSIDRELLKAYNDQMYKVLQELKTDKNKFVREAAMECINLISPPSKPQLESSIHRAKSASKRANLNSNIPQIPPSNNNATPINDNTPAANNNNKDNAKFVRKTSSKFVNKKLNLGHVTSTIDKTKFSKAFASNANEELEMPMVLVKEPKNIEGYKKMQQATEENFVKYMSEHAEPKKSSKKMDIEHSEIDNESKVHNNIEDDHNMQVEDVVDRSNLVNNYMSERNNAEERKQEFSQSFGDSDKKEFENMKKYIKILNGKFKDLSDKYTHVVQINDTLSTKVSMLEQNYAQLYNVVMQRGNNNTQEPFNNDSLFNQSMRYTTPERNMHMMSQNNTQMMPQSNIQMMQQPNMSLVSQSAVPNLTQSISPLPKADGNRWLNKTTNINTKLFNILSSNSDDAFFNFLRDSANYNNFNTIDNYLIEQLYSRLVDLLTKTANDNSLVAEYTLRWLHIVMSVGMPDNERDTKKIQSLLVYLSNNVEDEFLKEKIVQLLNHPHFDFGSNDPKDLSYA